MKILKTYDRPTEFYFTCNKCGCEFIANFNEVDFVECVEYREGVFYQRTNNPTAKEVRCACPDCFNVVYKTFKMKKNKSHLIDINIPTDRGIITSIAVSLSLFFGFILIKTHTNIGLIIGLCLSIISIVILISYMKDEE